ncbi:MAG TPA: NADAR family protein [Saprospiraceae bacterium]|nr:NADAR family protein [Saprospiraceae bacterium]
MWGDMSDDQNKPIRFFGKKSKFAIFSNFADTPVIIDGLYYLTTEHFFQSMKFANSDPEYAELVREAKTPLESKRLGKSREHPIDEKWADSREGQGNSIVIMRKALLCKALQHPEFKETLLSTGKREIIEASPYDSYWGEGKDKKGKNMLGKLLMELRKILEHYKDSMYEC